MREYTQPERTWDQGEPWPCLACGEATEHGNALCDPCSYADAGGDDAFDCVECGRATERLGHLCRACVAGWRVYLEQIEEEVER